MKLYKIVMRDSTPELVPVSSSGTFQTPDGKLYWIIPAEPEYALEPTLISQEPPLMNETQEKVITLMKEGVDSVVEISRRLNLTALTVTNIIRGAGLQTPSDILREKVKKAIIDAGKTGASSSKLGSLCSSGQRLGPLIRSMTKRGEVKRLDNGNYVTTIFLTT